MKTRTNAILYTVIVALLFAIYYMINKRNSKEFNWTPDYQTISKQPFGGYALDKMLDASWEYEFKHEYKNIYRLIDEEALNNENILILANWFRPSKEDVNALLNYVAEGHQALIAASFFGDYEYGFQDSLHFRVNESGLLDRLSLRKNPDTLRHKTKLMLCSPTFKKKRYQFPSVLCVNHFDSVPDTAQTIALKNDSMPVAIRYQIGEGSIILCSHPILFSNYGILSDEHEYVWGLLSYLNGAPLIRTEYYEVGYKTDSYSEFGYLLSQPPLRHALYLTLGTLLLFIVFTAKRRQRPIPIIKRPDNQLVHFVNSMAALYLRKSNNNDILKKKYQFFAEQLAKDYHIDIINRQLNQELFQQIALKTGAELKDVRTLFSKLDMLDSDFEINDDDLMDMVIRMDRIVRNINQ